ncbi:MAG TPA: TauD/TfdA family dioxygenase [Gammaproteobacteria bacterium]|nr:TauD/TfdA family dioxygenase [Gammaproteobacteria bacterium]
MKRQQMRIEALDEGFGAQITGVDLAGARVDAEMVAMLEAALLEHHVVAIRQQELDVNDVVAVSRRFGPLEPHVLDRFHHPETPLVLVLSNRVDADGRALGLKDAGSFWHSDVSFKQRPARATLLYAVEVPDEGGDTLFCDMMAAYDALPDELKHTLENAIAVHEYANRDRVAHRTGTKPRLDAENLRSVPPVRHPVVRRHPVTGRKALYVNPTYTVCIEGMEASRSESLLKEIFGHCLQDRFRMRYRWRPKDVVIWDNAAVMHSATTQNLDPSRHRTLWRTIIVGEPTH